MKLAGNEGDWDVAVFDATGRALAADASPDAQEVALGYTAGGRLDVQACRRSGDAASVPASLEFAATRAGALEEAKANPPRLVSVITPTKAQKDQLLALGLDMTEHGGKGSLGVVLHGKEDEEALRKAGLRWRLLVNNVVEQSRAQRAADGRFAARTARSDFPSGRDTYRTLADYNAELKALAEQNPNLVRLITLPNKTWMGKDVLGIEITENVSRNDGKPAFLNMGVHHAREWPSGEHAMEWGIELINGFKSGDPRATNIVRNSRNIVVPIVNADGFEASRNAVGAPAEGRDEAVDDTVYLVGGAATGGEYRRKNCRLPDDSEAGNCTTSAGLAENGVDPNRNYGGLWGGPGADPSNPLVQTYRGPGPFSEPESRNIQALVSRNQVMTLITNHTTAGLVLRAPGLAALGDPVDENRGYKALGDDMAKHNGYFSQKSFELYDTTGTTEDWSYNATGGFGFTFEIYCGAPNYDDRRLRRPRLPPVLRDDGQGVDRREPAGRPHAARRPERRLRRQGQPRGVLHRRREHPQRAAPQRARGQRAGRRHAAADQAVQDRDVPAAARRQAAPGRRQARDDLRRRHRRPRPLARQPLDAADRGQGDRRAQRGRAEPAAEPDRRRRRVLDHRGRPGRRGRRRGRRRQLQRHRVLQRPPDHGPGDRRQRVDERARVVAEPDRRLGRQALRGHQRRRQVAERRARREHEPDRPEQRRGGLGQRHAAPAGEQAATCCG